MAVSPPPGGVQSAAPPKVVRGVLDRCAHWVNSNLNSLLRKGFFESLQRASEFGFPLSISLPGILPSTGHHSPKSAETCFPLGFLLDFSPSETHFKIDFEK